MHQGVRDWYKLYACQGIGDIYTEDNNGLCLSYSGMALKTLICTELDPVLAILKNHIS